MDISLYLADVPERAAGPHPGWLLCPFVPDFHLPVPPRDGILIFTDSTAYDGQPPEAALAGEGAEQLPFLVLDLQRRDSRLTDWVSALRRLLPCPVAAPPRYAGSGPVFLPPIPPDSSPQAAVENFRGRDIVLDLSPLPTRLTLTKTGCQRTAARIPDGVYWTDDTLLCSYCLTSYGPDAVEFTLWRSKAQLLELARRLEIPRCVALRQEWESAV